MIMMISHSRKNTNFILLEFVFFEIVILLNKLAYNHLLQLGGEERPLDVDLPSDFQSFDRVG